MGLLKPTEAEVLAAQAIAIDTEADSMLSRIEESTEGSGSRTGSGQVSECEWWRLFDRRASSYLKLDIAHACYGELMTVS